MTQFTKLTETLIIGLNSDAASVGSRLRKIHSEIYAKEPNRKVIISTIKSISDTLSDMDSDLTKLFDEILQGEIGKEVEK